MRAHVHFLAAITLFGSTVHATPAAALNIGGGWTADQPGAVAYPVAVTGTGTSADAWKFTIALSSAVGTATTIHFTNDGTSSESYFNLTLEGVNTAANPWAGMSITIADTTEDPIAQEPDSTAHPERAHVHRSSWSETNSSHFKCVDAYCGGNGRYDMTLGLKAGANPIAQNDPTTGSILRLHDIDEAGTKPMKFDLTLTPVPEPNTALLLGMGLLALRLGKARHERAEVLRRSVSSSR